MNRSVVTPTVTVCSADPLLESRVEHLGLDCQKKGQQPYDIKNTTTSHFPTVAKSEPLDSACDDSEEEDIETRILKERVESLKKRLKDIEDRTNEEIEKIKVGVEEEITKRQQKIEASKPTHATNSDNEELEKQGAEAKDTITSLRIANKKLREDSRDLPRQIRELVAHNKALEESNEAFEHAKKEVQERLDSEGADNDKLNEIIPQYRAKIKEFEDSLESRSDLGEAENKIKKLYCDFNIKLVDLVQEKSSEHTFVDEIVAIQEAATSISKENSTEPFEGRGEKTTEGKSGVKSNGTEATSPLSGSDEDSVNIVA